MYYQGKLELDFLENFYDKIHIIRGTGIKYIFENNEHMYFPDFFIPSLNLIIEIKSSYWYNKHFDLNKAKKDACLTQKYNYILILDKNYFEFMQRIVVKE